MWEDATPRQIQNKRAHERAKLGLERDETIATEHFRSVLTDQGANILGDHVINDLGERTVTVSPFWHRELATIKEECGKIMV